MQPMKQLRVWHALIAILATAAYFAEDAEPWHQLLGYGVVTLIAIRLLMAMFGSGLLGLQRFYPKFHDLKLGTAATHPAISRVLLLGIAISLLGVTTTGVLMDRGRTLQSVAGMPMGKGAEEGGRGGAAGDSALLRIRDDHDAREGGEDGEDRGEGGEDREDGPLGEVHELFANLLIGLVALHVSYLMLFKWPLARFMLFVSQPKRAPAK